MPWIDKEICTGCEICIGECPVFTIHMIDSKAEIEMNGCIRCGICHDICDFDAVKHDSEKVDELIEEKVWLAKRNRDLGKKISGSAKYGKECLERTIKSYKREQKILQKSIGKLEELYKAL